MTTITDQHEHGSIPDEGRSLTRLQRIEGQVRVDSLREVSDAIARRVR